MWMLTCLPEIDKVKIYESVVGIGYYTAIDLARRNARVILACRNTQTATAAAAEMQQETGNENIVVRELDLSLLKSVRKFASVILEQESRLDILVNNAGTTGSLTSCMFSVRDGWCLKIIICVTDHYALLKLNF